MSEINTEKIRCVCREVYIGKVYIEEMPGGD